MLREQRNVANVTKYFHVATFFHLIMHMLHVWNIDMIFEGVWVIVALVRYKNGISIKYFLSVILPYTLNL